MAGSDNGDSQAGEIMAYILDTSKLDRIIDRLQPRAEMVLDKLARDIEAGWKGRIIEKHVIDTGAYLNSVHVKPKEKPLERIISDGVEYGVYQEFGTTRIAARPCASPAVEAVRKSFDAAFTKLFRP